MRILITAPYHKEGQRALEAGLGEVIYKPWKPQGRAYNEDELIKLLEASDANALITEHDRVTGRVLKSFPDLKFIGVCRGTPSNVNLDVARSLDIPVFNTPGRNAVAVAEMLISNVIALLRRTIPGREWLCAERWEEGAHTSYLEFKGNELSGKKVGLVGFGAIGQLIAKIARAFSCEILFYDPYVTDEFEEYRKVSLEELFEKSDIVSIHLPANAETSGMIDKKLFIRMHSDAVFVNTARASVVKREDLFEVLKDYKIRGAVLDVFDHEPPDKRDYDIIHLPNVLATPHIAGATHEVEDHHVAIMNRQLIRAFAGDRISVKDMERDF